MRALSAALLMLLATGPAACDDPVAARIYPAPKAPLSLAGLPRGAELIGVVTADGVSLKGLAVAARADRPTLLILHGNGFSAGDVLSWFAPAIARGYGVVAAEYRGYSGNPGRPSERGLAADADAFLTLARERAGDRPVWIVGHSLGGGVAVPLAERSPPDLLVTIGTFTRLRDMVSGPIRAVVPDAYRTLDAVPRANRPWFIIHGLADPVVPAAHGQALHRAAVAAGRTGAAFTIAGAGHNPDGVLLAGILDAIRTRPEGGAPAADGLPAGVRIMPFG